MTTFRSLLLLAARFALYMGVALLAIAALRTALTDTTAVLHHLMVR